MNRRVSQFGMLGWMVASVIVFTGCPKASLQISVSALTIPAGASSGTFAISNGGRRELNWTATASETWVTLAPASGTNNATVTVTIDQTTLPLGINTATITIGSAEGTRTIDVSIEIVPPDLEAPEAEVMIEEGAASGSFAIRNIGGQALNWTASSSQSWVSLSQTSGANNATVIVNIDQSELPFGENTAMITIVSAGGTQSFNVTINVGGGINGPYWPLAEGNSWTFSVPGSGGEVALEMTVDREFQVNGVPIFEMSLSSPPLGIKSGATPATVGTLLDLASGGNSLGPLLSSVPTDAFLPLSRLEDVAGELDPDGTVYNGILGADPLAFLADPFYLVSSTEGHFLAFSEEKLDQLPSTAGMLPWDFIANTPGQALYGLEAGVFDTTGQEIFNIVYAAAGHLGPLTNDLETYFAAGLSDDLIALMLALGADLRAFDSDSDIADAIAQVLGATAQGTDDIRNFTDGLDAILTGSVVVVRNLAGPLSEYLTPVSVPVIEGLLRLFSNQFSTYENPDPVVQDVGRLLGVLTGHLATIIRSVDDQDYLLNDPNITNLFDAILEYIDGTIATPEAILNDPIGILEDLTDFVAELPHPGQGATEVHAALVAVLESVEVLARDLRDTRGQNRDLGNARDLTTNLHSFFVLAVDNDPGNVLLQYLEAVTLVVDQFADLIVEVEPFIDDVTGSVRDLGEAYTHFGPGDFDPAAYQAMFDAIAASATSYNELHTDVAARALAIVASAAGDLLGMVDEAQDLISAVEIEQRQGALSSFLPLDFAGATYLLGDFPGGDQADSVASFVTVPAVGTVPEHELIFTIYARDVGPMFLFGLPLRSAVVDGTPIGAP